MSFFYTYWQDGIKKDQWNQMREEIEQETSRTK